MSERSHPASPRRLALARAAGWVAHSPSLTTAAAWAGALAALAITAPAQFAAWRALWRQAAIELSAGELDAGALALRAASAIAASALPVLAVAAVAALAAHLLQVRAFFVPRRRVPGAPPVPRSARRRLGAAAWALARAAALTAVGLAATWASFDELVTWGGGPAPSAAVAAGARVALALAATWAALGAVELIASALLRQAALRMTASEHRQEVREQAGAGGFWRRRPGSPAASEVGAARRHLADATVLVLGDAVAAAVRWQPSRRPEPEVILVRRGPAASYAVALARRSEVPVVRSPTLAAQLAAAVSREGDRADVPALARAELAELVVAVRRGGAPR